MERYGLLFLCVCIGLIDVIRCTHFRGGAFWWKAVEGEPNMVEICLRVAWRRDYSASTFCDEQTVQSQRYIGPVNAGYLVCKSGCTGRVGNVNFKCTDFSIAENWSGGINCTKHVLKLPNQNFTLEWTGRGWLETEAHPEDAEWSIKMSGNLSTRTDINTINSSPKATMAPVVRLQLGCDMSVSIPVVDDNQDIIRCRWANKAENECGGICSTPSNVILEEGDCRIQFTEEPSEGYYALALQVEDYKPDDRNFVTPLSSVPLQFLAHIYRSDGECEAVPTFIQPTPENGACITLKRDSPVRIQIVVRMKDEVTRVHEVTTVSESGIGVVRTPVLPYGTQGQNFYVNVTWTVTPEQQPPESSVFCFSVVDSKLQSSEQRCIYLIFGAKPPQYTSISASTMGETVFITYDQHVQLDRSNKFINIYDNDGREQLSLSTSSELISIENNTLVISVPDSVKLRGILYALLSKGVVYSEQTCGEDLPSDAVTKETDLIFFVEGPTTEEPSTLSTKQMTVTDTTPGIITQPTISAAPASSNDTNNTAVWIAVAVFVALAFLVLLTVAIYALIKRRKKNEEKNSEQRQLEHWAHLQNLRMGYDGPYQPDFNSLDVKFR